jgi:hypothetical protein
MTWKFADMGHRLQRRKSRIGEYFAPVLYCIVFNILRDGVWSFALAILARPAIAQFSGIPEKLHRCSLGL